MHSSSDSSSDVKFVEVAVSVPVRETFTYRLPSSLPSDGLGLAAGTRVVVPLRRRRLVGFVVGPASPPSFRTQEILAVLDERPVFDDELFGFLCAAADYYLHPVGEVLRAAAPALRKDALRSIARAFGPSGAGELTGRRLAARYVVWARTVGGVEPARCGSRSREVLAVVRARGEVSLPELDAVVPGGRAVARALARRGLLHLEARPAAENPFFEGVVEPVPTPEPTFAQAEAIARITKALAAAESRTFLLHGVTGSGKTEVYLRAIAEARAQDRGALVLVPEIALTPQLVTRFRARFGDGIAVLHSGLTDRARDVAWRALREGRVSLAIGARSALFAPVPRLGVVVVDEEHDGSYKQEEGFRYHARDMAVLRAKRAGAVAILGSATPSLESYARARRGAYELLELRDRATAHALPSVEVVDLSRTGAGPSGDPLLSLPLHRALERTLAAGEQAVLFLNRRGFAPTLRCAACGAIARCPACSVALTEHRGVGLLRCHYCDFATPLGTACPTCGVPALEGIGLGTEKLETVLERTFPGVRVARLDRDVASGRGVEDVLDRVRRREVDVLVGTQMVTKGHDLPDVTLVGVLCADHALAFPDFRAAERTFQLLTQVAGRAGRGERPGRVVFQTYQPNEPAVAFAVRHDYLAFARDELRKRRELGYPPFGRLVAVRVDAADEAVAERTAAELASTARAAASAFARSIEILGPAPAPIARVRGRFRFRFLLKARARAPLREVATAVLARIQRGLAPARASLDVDPVNML